MQNANLRETYSKLVDAKLREESIFAGLFNQKHDGAAVAGAVKIPVRAEATVGAYDIEEGGELNHTATTYQTLVCDKDFYVNELIDGFEAAAVPDGMVAERLDSAGYALADKFDSILANLAATTGTAFTATKKGSTVYGTITEAIQTARKLKVKKSEMWLVASPDYVLEIINDPNFISASALGDAVKMNGIIGKIGGVYVFESSNLPEKVDFVLGNNVYCHFVNAWMVTPSVVDIKDGLHIGASAVQGRKVGGAVISKANTVLVLSHA